jgi:hypothetical protein
LRGFDHSTPHDQLSYPDVLVVKAQKTVYIVHVKNLNLTTSDIATRQDSDTTVASQTGQGQTATTMEAKETRQE